MRNIKINEAESIFEPFYDGGDSYPGHQKYACLSKYIINTHGAGKVEQTWWTANIVVYGRQQENVQKAEPVSIERTCLLDIRGYDIFRVFASVSQNIRFRVICCIDGVDKEVIHATGIGVNKEYDGAISGSQITKIRVEFENLSTSDAGCDLIWMGLSNAAKEMQMTAQESPYDEKWEGCFKEETPDMIPQIGLYFDGEELEELREKVKTTDFSDCMDRLRVEAREAMRLCPEKEVDTFVHRPNKRFVRERDFHRPSFPEKMIKLAFVGLIDKDVEMLRMACRMALAVAHCEYFCESIMGVLPGATWHHRSFTEETVCKALIKVLDWAGDLLSWHGKNIIYDAIIIKGLPRLDADIKTMDYMWKMNQGPVFASGLIIINIALAKRYPRYITRVQEAEKDLLAMWDNYVQSDGGSAEGPGYLGYTLRNMTEALYLLARFYGKSLEEYVPASIRKSSIYAHACLSDAGDFFVPVNDAHPEEGYPAEVLNFLARMNAGDIWKAKSNLVLEQPQMMSGDVIKYLIFGQRYAYTQQEDGTKAASEELINLPITGHTTLRRKTKDLGTVGLHMISGLITFGHAHGDKGSFILEAGGKPLLIDRGVCSYDNAFTSLIGNSEYHNMVTAVKEGKHLCQNKKNTSCSGIVTEVKREEEAFYYTTDITACWDGVFLKNVRRLYSTTPYQYVVEDELEINPEYQVCFVLNTYDEIMEEAGTFIIEDQGMGLTISTKNWHPDKVEYGPCGTDGNGRTVNRLCLYIGGSEKYLLTTEITLRTLRV